MNVCSVIWFEVYLGFFVLYGVYWLSINNIGLIINYVKNSVVIFWFIFVKIMKYKLICNYWNRNKCKI